MFFCFFKQKTAYEMRISDWSSDVCSSDLLVQRGDEAAQCHQRRAQPDPAHEGLDVQAYRPVALGAVRIVAGAQRFDKRDVDVTEQSEVDAGLGHTLAADGVRARLLVPQRQRLAVALPLAVADVGGGLGDAG